MSDVNVFTAGHSAVRFESEGKTLVIDAGVWNDTRVFEQVDAFLITHEHFDHCDAGRIAGALIARMDAQVWAPGSAVELLLEAGAPANQLHRVESGTEFVAAGFQVSTHGGLHATIHPALPEVQNIAYLVDGRVYHPGDSFAAPKGSSVELLFLPVAAPWLDLHGAADFTEAVGPSIAVPIHDDVLSAAGKEVTDHMLHAIFDTFERDVVYRRGSDDAAVFTYSAG